VCFIAVQQVICAESESNSFVSLNQLSCERQHNTTQNRKACLTRRHRQKKSAVARC
jgi:hypothetical protein